ncbi:hypothetical protein FS837_005983 [Tulasnella sp. UAMH 9824]|nr:hypothetical protein FS837_005983 [Tulasnella sp. UAMH 9824]
MSAENNTATEQETTCPAANLNAYAASALLPKMNREIHLAKDENPRGDFWIDTKIPRALLEVRQIESELIYHLARKYPIPDEEIPEPSLLALNALALPGRNHPCGNPKTLARFEGVARTKEDVGHWVDQVVLNTARAMLNLMHPFDGWVAVPQRRSPIRATPIGPRGEDIIECEVNVMRRQIPALNIFQTHLVVFSFPPWKVTLNDLWEFSKHHQFYLGLLGFLAEPCESSVLRRKDKMWYFIHDTCRIHDCRWFVVTSADYWSFGTFHAGWKTAYAIPALPFFNRTPTILQVLILWTMSSLYENEPETPFVLSLRVLHRARAAEPFIEGCGDEMLEPVTYEIYIRYLWEHTSTEIDESESVELTTSWAGSGVLPEDSFVTQTGGEAPREPSSIIVVQDQAGPLPANQSIFRQATLNSPRARGSHRFSPYPLPSSQIPQDSSREALSTVEASADSSGNIAAGPGPRVDKGKGREIDIVEEALPTISSVLDRAVSALGSVLSLAFRNKPNVTQNVRTVEKWGETTTVVTDAPSSPVAGPSFIRQADVIDKEDEDFVDSAL